MNLDWQDSAACASADPDLFSGDTPNARRLAVAICARCPVRDACYAHAADNATFEVVQGGVWWDARGNPTSVRGAITAVVEDGSPAAPPLTCPGGHPSSRYRWISKRCDQAGCKQANTYYEHHAYLRRKQRRSEAA
jgi:WhiB family redox-sensing transcriptional regulator